MSRPGAWSRVFTNLKKYLAKDFSEKSYIGQDAAGHRYYEIRNSRQNVSRGFDPPPGVERTIDYQGPSVEWTSWLKGTRRFPPAEDEIAFNRSRQQAQLSEDAETEKRAPTVHSKGKGASETGQKHDYPKYKDFEASAFITPGAPPPRDEKP